MAKTRLSNCFKINLIFWKIFGLWPGRTPSKYYKFYTITYVSFTFLFYNILLTLNLIYTPRSIELLVREVIFYFTEVAVAGKVLMILLKRKKILEAFDLLDCEFFKGNEYFTKKIVNNSVKKYLTCWKVYAFISNFSYASIIVIPIMIFLIFGNELVLPVCRYYFLSDEVRDYYFTSLFFYQSFGIYGHMTYNVNIDSFMAGLMFMTITQLKMINYKLRNIRLTRIERKEEKQIQEQILNEKLIECIKHYEIVLKFNSIIQDLISLAMFIQFGMASAIICVVLCVITMVPLSTEITIFMSIYLLIMVSQIFVPGWIGTQLSHENQELVFAAYNSDWMARSEKFKKSLRLLVERANNPMVITGLKMFPLALGTFTSIIKLSYSFFTLLRNMQARQDKM